MSLWQYQCTVDMVAAMVAAMEVDMAVAMALDMVAMGVVGASMVDMADMVMLAAMDTATSIWVEGMVVMEDLEAMDMVGMVDMDMVVMVLSDMVVVMDIVLQVMESNQHGELHVLYSNI